MTLNSFEHIASHVNIPHHQPTYKQWVHAYTYISQLVKCTFSVNLFFVQCFLYLSLGTSQNKATGVLHRFSCGGFKHPRLLMRSFSRHILLSPPLIELSDLPWYNWTSTTNIMNPSKYTLTYIRGHTHILNKISISTRMEWEKQNWPEPGLQSDKEGEKRTWHEVKKMLEETDKIEGREGVGR